MYIPDVTRANGKCEYCLLRARYSVANFEIDHIFALKHGGSSTIDNLCLCCPDCNRQKSNDLASLDPRTNEPAFLFHPRRDIWTAHFRVSKAYIEPITPSGWATASLLLFNSSFRVRERTRLLRLGMYP
jgi:hypothetical protein